MADDTPTPTPAPTEPSFEALLKDLTQVVERLERGNLPLDESIALYARGSELVKGAQGVLERAQARLEVLIAAPDGTLKTDALDVGEFLGEK